MARMADGSETILAGTYVRVDQRAVRDGEREVIPARTFYAKVVGTDGGAGMYEVGRRFAGAQEWRFGDGGWWAFPREVTVLEDQEEALRIPIGGGD